MSEPYECEWKSVGCDCSVMIMPHGVLFNSCDENGQAMQFVDNPPGMVADVVHSTLVWREAVSPVDPLHANGRCTCAGEGRCLLCLRHQWEEACAEKEWKGTPSFGEWLGPRPRTVSHTWFAEDGWDDDEENLGPTPVCVICEKERCVPQWGSCQLASGHAGNHSQTGDCVGANKRTSNAQADAAEGAGLRRFACGHVELDLCRWCYGKRDCPKCGVGPSPAERDSSSERSKDEWNGSPPDNIGPMSGFGSEKACIHAKPERDCTECGIAAGHRALNKCSASLQAPVITADETFDADEEPGHENQ